MKKWTATISGLVLATLLTGCAGAVVNSIALPSDLQLTAGQQHAMPLTYEYSKQGLDMEAQNKAIENARVTWSVSGDAVAVDANGMLRAQQGGDAIVTASTKDGKTASCTVTVLPLIEKLVLDPQAVLELGGKESLTLSVQKTPSNAAGEILWSSSDETVATVADGTVTAVGTGECTITAQSNGVSAQTTVQVGVAATGIRLAQDSGILTAGNAMTIQVYTLPKEAAAADASQLEFTSSDETVATVDSKGQVTAHKAGSANITAVYQGDKTAVYKLTVQNKPQPKPAANGSSGKQGQNKPASNQSSKPSAGGGSGSTGSKPAPAPAPQPAPAPAPQPTPAPAPAPAPQPAPPPAPSPAPPIYDSPVVDMTGPSGGHEVGDLS